MAHDLKSAKEIMENHCIREGCTETIDKINTIKALRNAYRAGQKSVTDGDLPDELNSTKSTISYLKRDLEQANNDILEYRGQLAGMREALRILAQGRD